MTGIESIEYRRNVKYETIVFEREDEYVGFVHKVYERFGGNGLGFTNVSIRNTVRAQQWLLEEFSGQFPFRPVNEEDREKEKVRLAGRKPYALENLADFRVPVVQSRKKGDVENVSGE